MTPTQRRLYSALIQLHPAEFRHRFGSEMLLDFKDALETHGALPLYLDALQSAIRQWASQIFPGKPQPQPAYPSLLSGRYVALSQPNPSPFELLRAACISLLLFASIGLTTSHRFSSVQIANAGIPSLTSKTPTAVNRTACRIPRLHAAGASFATSAPAVKSAWVDPAAEYTYEFNLWPAATYAVLLCFYFTLRNYLRKRRALRH